MLTSFAYKAVVAVSKIEPIPPAPHYNPFGDQVILGSGGIAVFNGLLKSGEITPGP